VPAWAVSWSFADEDCTVRVVQYCFAESCHTDRLHYRAGQSKYFDYPSTIRLRVDTTIPELRAYTEVRASIGLQ